MKAARRKGNCVVCQAPEAIRVAINAAIWTEGSTLRSANYRAAGARAAAQVAMTMPDGEEADRYTSLDPKTITRHADHIEDDWRDVMAGDRLQDDEVPVIAHEFGSVMDTATDLGMLSMKGLRDAMGSDPSRFAILFPKETIAMAKLGVIASGNKESSRLKRNQQKIDVMAIFAASAGFVSGSRGATDDEEAEATVSDMKAALSEERKQIAAGGG